MTQYDFDKLMEKYLQGDCTPEEQVLLQEWADQQLRQRVSPVVTEAEKTTTEKRLWQRIRKSALPHTFFKIQGLSWYRLGLAASFLMILVAAYALLGKPIFSKNDPLKGVEIVNTTNIPQKITLNDGSIVTLQPNSVITFPEKFGEHNRIVYLKGEGFFHVKRDTNKPFYVYAGDLVTEVLGTSFTVKSYEHGRTAEVIVTSGKVLVYNALQGKSTEEIGLPKRVLTPNQKIIYEKTTHQLISKLVEEPIIVNQPKSAESLSFQEEAVVNILKKMSILYGVTIQPNAALQDCYFTGDLNDLGFHTQLDVICKSINAQVIQTDTTIVVEGKGCK